MSSWKDVDEWAAKQPRVSINSQRKKTDYTARAATRIANGVHPLNIARLANNGETCGSCRFLFDHSPSPQKKFFKCEKFGFTRGPGTDCRKKWPACERWEKKP